MMSLILSLLSAVAAATIEQCCETGRVFSRMRDQSSINEVYVWIKRCTIDPYIIYNCKNL